MIFPVTSRYHNIETAKRVIADGREVIYLQRRFLPPALDDGVLIEHTVSQAERLDNITARHLGDPEQFWRLCDANNAMHPDELTAEIGRRLRIPMFNGD